jgi:nitrile hydratase subunit alpha
MHEGEHRQDHAHHAGHDHADEPGEKGLTYYQAMEVAVRELLIEKKLITADELRAAVELMDARSPALGARVVAHAWVDAGFRQRLLEDAAAACRELGIDVGSTKLVAVENTGEVHNVLVCTEDASRLSSRLVQEQELP